MAGKNSGQHKAINDMLPTLLNTGIEQPLKRRLPCVIPF